MALHGKAPEATPIELNPLYSQGGEESHAPRAHAPRRRARSRRRVPARARRADARRQRAAQPRHVRHHVDGAAGAAADGRDVRQEHDRQGRVPADRRDRAALRATCSAGLWNSPDAERRRPACRRPARARRRCSAGMALKWRWRERAEAAGQADRQAQPGDGRQRPGLLGEVLPLLGRRAAARADGGRPLPPRRRRGGRSAATRTPSAWSPILGSTFDGSYEPVAEICAALDKLAGRAPGSTSRSTSTRASGGFIAPFLDPDLVWDFRLPRVQSINTSGHKYGLVYPGVGWVIWRDADALPDDLVFNVNYLGGDMPTFALNFSRPGRPGRRAVLQLPAPRASSGYRRVQQASPRRGALSSPTRSAAWTTSSSSPTAASCPVFAFTLEARRSTTTPSSTCRERLRERGWLVPAYTLPREPPGPRRAARRRAQRLLAATSPTCSSPTCSVTPRTSTSSRRPCPTRAASSFSH